MKKIVVISILALTLLLSGCFPFRILGDNAVRGSGRSGTETRQLASFDRIDLNGSGDVEIIFGDEESIVVEADDNLLSYIETNVSGGELSIGFKPLTAISTRSPMRFTITMKSLEGVEIDGSGSVVVAENAFDTLDLRIDGSGDLRAAGTANRVQVEINGSGTVECMQLQASNVSVTLRGSGDVDVYASEILDVEIPGSGTVNYKGSPVVDTNIRGSGSVNEKN